MPYFDHNATTPLALCARETWLRLSDEAWQNPSSPYTGAARARIRLDTARESLALLLGAKAERVVFNSGATEGANAVLAHWAKILPRDAIIALNPTEHPCVLAAAAAYFPGRIEWLGVDRAGVVSLAQIEAWLNEKKIAGVVVMAANNETGVIQPWAKIAALCSRAAVPFFCDVSQWLGKLPAGGLGACSWVIGAAHKFGGPKGAGFVVCADGAQDFRALHGGEQENGHRAGTEDVASIGAMISALTEAEQKKVFLEDERLRWRAEFERKLVEVLPGAEIIGAGADRLWNTVAFLLPPGGDNQRWVLKLDKRGCQVSTGSACATGKAGPSHVLAAIGRGPEEMRRLLRVSAGWETTLEDWAALTEALREVGRELIGSSEGVKR